MSVIERVAVLFNTASRWVAASAWPSRSRPSNSISASIPPGLGGIRIPTGSLPLVITRGPDFGRFRRTFAVSFESSRVFKRSVFTNAMSDTWGTFVKSQFATPLRFRLLSSVSVSSFTLTRSLPLVSPFGPTFGCSISLFPKARLWLNSPPGGAPPYPWQRLAGF